MEFRFKDDVQSIECDDFWYDLTDGGYLDPAEVLEDEDQVKQLNDAISLVYEFQQAIEANFSPDY